MMSARVPSGRQEYARPSTARLRAVLLVAPVLVLFLMQPAYAQDASLLSRERVATLPEGERAPWLRYLELSALHEKLDRSTIAAQLATSGLARMTPAPAGRAFTLDDTHTAEWFQTAAARRTADIILSFQTPSGGWSKRIDYSRGARQPGTSYSSADGWSYVGTFDNDATTEQLRFLSRFLAAQPAQPYRIAFLKGIQYVLAAQFPNGCWPQVYPLQGGYHDAATYNDDAMVRVLEVLREVVSDSAGLVPADTRDKARAALRRGTDCIVRTQVVVNGVKTVWCAQHDPLTLVPVSARAYEHASLSGAESAGVMRFLMQIEAPDRSVIDAVHAAAAWFRATAIHDVTYDPPRGLTRQSGAGPVWARFSEIDTNRPIFSNRDGIIRYEFSALDEERRLGYAWYSDRPAGALRAYERWARRNSL